MNRAQRTQQNKLNRQRRITALALVLAVLALAAGVVLQTMDRSFAANAQPITPQSSLAPQPTASAGQDAADALPIRSIQVLEARQASASTALMALPANQNKAPGLLLQTTAQPTAAILQFLADTPLAGVAEPARVEDVQRKQSVVVAAQPQFSLMPADFLRDDLTGKDAPALKRLLKRWGFSDSDDKSAWNAEDAYHLSLYQRWAKLKPSGAVDTATRKSLLITWGKYADRAIPRQRLPLEGRYIGLNPGHQNRNYDRAITPDNEEKFWNITVGTRGRVTGLYEYELNLTVALKARDALQAQGARVLLSRTDNDVRVSNSSRTKQLNREQVDAVLLIHADGNADPGLHGLHMIVSTAGGRQSGAVLQRSHALADAMQRACIAQTQAADRGVGERDNLRILLSSCAMPAALIEMGYMTNPAEDRLLATEAYQNKIVAGIVQGFLDYFRP